MTPKEKAIELFEKYDKNIVSTNYKHMCKEAVIQCALIAVDECLNTCVENMIYYWREVKQEIENYIE